MRILLGWLSAAALALPGAALARPLDYRGYTVAFGAGIPERQQRQLEGSLRCQIDIVETVALGPQVLGGFRRVPLSVESSNSRGPGRYQRGRGIALKPTSLSDKTPVLLHELLHAYHYEVMPPMRQQELAGFYQRAKIARLFPPDSYMMSNDHEFFAMTASTLLNGRIQRDPNTRAALKTAMPVYYDWLLAMFGLTENRLVPARERSCG